MHRRCMYARFAFLLAFLPVVHGIAAAGFAAAEVTSQPATAAVAAAPTGGLQLGNRFLAASISQRGELCRLENHLTGETYSIAADRFAVTTDQGVLRNDAAAAVQHESGPDRLAFHFSAGPNLDVTLEYTLATGHAYLERRLLLRAKRPMTLLGIDLAETRFATRPAEFIKYDTFWECPTVCFLRWPKGGLFAGIANPFFDAAEKDGLVAFSFQPALLLAAGENYASEPQFLGVYKSSGRQISDWWPRTSVSNEQGGLNRPRFRNPCGHIPLDWNEIQAMRRFAADYLDPQVDRFLSILYMYWFPIEQGPNSPEIEAKYMRVIDQFHALGGDMIIFNPLRAYDRPGAGKDSYWELAPPGSPARRILDHADRAGIHYGFYMGVAHTGDRGNACGLPFVPERKDWKKTDPLGGACGENCMACDEFADWWYAVQRNTIAKYGLRLWSWDPGPGNGMYCYSDRHGHIPGRGGYKGWRSATQLMARLKHEFPGLYLMAFYGRKEYGLWGFKYFDQHESYWEQTIFFGATVHPDLHDDRVNADGARFQSWWNENFRFLPTMMNHALTGRIGENCYDRQLPKVWDHLGWKYSLMSGIASSGSVTACILPDDVSLVSGMREFYAKWLGWARQNFSYVKHNITFGDQVRSGGIDGHARIDGDHGFIFLCNPGPRPTRTRFLLDESIGLSASGQFTLRQLYPNEDCLWFDHTHERGIVTAGEEVAVEVPAYEVMLLELRPHRAEQLPLVYGIGGHARQEGSTLRIDGATGERGTMAQIVVEPEKRGQSPFAGTATTNAPRRCPVLRTKGNCPPFSDPGITQDHLVINGQTIPLIVDGARPRAEVRFAGPTLARMLDDWHTTDGGRFEFPRHPAAEHLQLSATFHADPAIRAILKSAEPANLVEIAPLVERWRNDPKLPHNFVWARPDRLWLVLPFADADRVRAVRLQCNAAEAAVQCFRVSQARVIYYVDLTDRVQWGADNRLDLSLDGLGENQFLGPYLDYPPAALTTQVAVSAGDGRAGQGRRTVGGASQTVEPSISALPVTNVKAATEAPPRRPMLRIGARRPTLRAFPPVVFDGPVEAEMPGRDLALRPTGSAPTVLSAAIDPPFLGGPRPITLTAKVDLPPEKLRGVYVSGGWLGSVWPMGYHAASKTWRVVSNPPRRFPILDGDRAVFWAIGRDGQFSPSRAVPVKWLLGPAAPAGFAAAQASPWANVREDASEAIRSAGAPLPNTVDFRFAPPDWQAAICLPDDPDKALAGKEGQFLDEFGWEKDRPFALSIQHDVEGAKCVKQQLLAARVPVVETTKQAGAVRIEEQLFVVPPKAGAAAEKEPLLCPSGAARQAREIRGWAKPSVPCDPAFHDVAAGWEHALDYELRVAPGQRMKVVVGLCEGWHDRAGIRPLKIEIEGAAPRIVDPIAAVGKNRPMVCVFDATDSNGDGRITIHVTSAPGATDQIPIVNVLWAFPPDRLPSDREILSGQGRDRQYAYLACGSSPAPYREYLLIARYVNEGRQPAHIAPRLTICSSALALRRESGTIFANVTTSIRASVAPLELKLDKPRRGVVVLPAIDLPPGGSESVVFTIHRQGVGTLRAVSPEEAAALRDDAIHYWNVRARLPFDVVTIPDPGIQQLIDSCIRNIYQAREIKKGLPAFQVGPTCYRGLWIADGSFLLEAAAILGRGDESRAGIDYFLTFQRPDGGIRVMDRFWKESGLTLWAATRQARLAQDKAWLRERWPKLKRIVAYIESMRHAESAADPHALDYRLLPWGFVDGGVWQNVENGVLKGTAEFSDVYWSLAGLKAMIRAAHWLGDEAQAADWQREYDDFYATFHHAAQREVRSDPYGNRYVPIMMGTHQADLPQRGQWTFCHAVYPGELFAKDDPIAVGTLDMLRATETEGLVLDTGWLHGGIWNYFASFYGHALLWQGEGQKAAQVLYAFANHASPMLDWREEQTLHGQGLHNVGDMPHNWASAEFIRLTVHLLALDRGEELHLFEGLPREWTRRGMHTRLRGVRTPFGPLELELQVAEDGKTAHLTVRVPGTGCKAIVVHLGGWASPDATSVRRFPPDRPLDVTIPMGP